MSRFIRRALPFLAIAAIAGAACEVPIKKAPPKPAPPTEVGPAPPGVNPCTTDPVVITGDACDWLFQPDPNFATTFAFTDEQASIGNGSLKAGPISDNPPDKFIAAKGLGIPVSELLSIAYDFLIAGAGEDSDANHFYLNIYTNVAGSNTFFDCRFDYVPSEGSTANFTTRPVAATDTPSDTDGSECTTTLAEMPEGSTVSFFSLNIGDTSANDDGLAGFLDNVKVTTTSGTTTYDFEPA